MGWILIQARADLPRPAWHHARRPVLRPAISTPQAILKRFTRHVHPNTAHPNTSDVHPITGGEGVRPGRGLKMLIDPPALQKFCNWGLTCGYWYGSWVGVAGESEPWL
jgi:hypothetical protein